MFLSRSLPYVVRHRPIEQKSRRCEVPAPLVETAVAEAQVRPGSEYPSRAGKDFENADEDTGWATHRDFLVLHVDVY